MKRLISTAILAIAAIGLSMGAKYQLIDSNWQFSNDSLIWRSVDLPHDWSIEGDFSQSAPANNDGAYLPTGKGYYTKNLHIDRKAPDKCYRLYFEGAYMNSEVKVNGKKVGGHPYGYSSFFCDITDAVKDGDNIIEVMVDNSLQRNCRWYTGSGIYRHVWTIESNNVHFEPWGIAITTDKAKNGDANINILFSVDNHLAAPLSHTCDIAIIDPHGNVSSATSGLNISSDQNNVNVALSKPMLWDIDSPNIYKAMLMLKDDSGKCVDTLYQDFGIRYIDFSTNGFLLNGKPLLLNGACVHHDNGLLGAKSYDAAEYRKAKLLKDAGFNAVRCSHNPPAPAFLKACDEIGLLVIDESFDGWRQSKTEHDYAELFDSCWHDDVTAMVLRDRNHPSVIAWSIGNEVIERKQIEIVTTAHKLAWLCRNLDPSRPVTSALAAWDNDWEIYDPLAAELDITGYNYMIHKAEGDHERVPDRIMWQTESYPRDAFQNWKTAVSHPYILGDFVWTGIDYLGESGIGRHYYNGQVPGEHWERQLWPWHGALCGDIDITGYRKPISHYREFLYNKLDGIYMAVREPNGYKGEIKETLWGNYPTYESWNWQGWEGKPIDVEVITSEPTVKLYLNDTLIGEKECNEANGWKAIFSLDYQPGALTAKAGVKSTTIYTAGKPAGIRLTADKNNYMANGQDVAFVIAEVVDANGHLVPNADCDLIFTVKGPGVILGTCSADMTDLQKYTSNTRHTSNGRALVAIRTTDKKGKIKLNCSTNGIKAQTVLLSK